MTVRVLGPLDVGDPPLSPRERTILSALIVRAGAALAPAELADAFWGERTPQTWPAQVKTSVARIRRRLGASAVTTLGGSYALGLDPDAIDAIRFERLVSSARQHALHGEHDRAVDAYERALALWRGHAYPDVADWEPGAAEALRLDEIRRDAEEERVDSLLHTRDARQAIPVAERLVHEAPLREERWALLAVANYRAGRQAEALAALRTARATLLDELGIEPGARLTELESAILRQDPVLLDGPAPARASEECPYRGLDAYGPDDADTYFGRDADLDALVERVRPGQIVTITGPSGSGKSSLAQAGLLARLAEGRRRFAVVHPSVAGLASLRAAMARDGVDVILVDQAEELLAFDDAELDAFCLACEGVLDGGTLVLTVRSDFLDAATNLPRIGPALGRGVYALAPITPEAYREIIERPARRAGLRCEPGLVELILRDVAGRAASLPLVSYALVETWARREGATLTVAGYEAAGGIGGAIAASAEIAYGAMTPEEQEICHSLLLRLVERDADGTTLRKHPQAAPLQSSPARRVVLDLLADARLVTTEGDAVVIAHETVATAWPRLDAWLEEDARGARLLATVSAGADQWETAGRPDDDLLRGGRLQLVRDWKEETHPDLTDSEAEFLAASEARHSDELRLLQMRARRDRRQNGMLRILLIVAAVLLVGAIVAGVLAVVRGRDAAAAAEDATREAFTSRAQSLVATNRSIAALMAVAAYRHWPEDPRTRATLLASVTEAGPFVGATYVPGADWRVGMWPIPGTTTMVIVRDQVDVEIFDYRAGTIVRKLPIRLTRPNTVVRPWVRVSADGSTIAIVQHDENKSGTSRTQVERVSFFDLRTGKQFGSTVDAPTATDTISLSPDGAHLTWATIGVLVVIDRDTGAIRTRKVDEPDPHDRWTASSAFGAHGELMVATMSGQLLQVDPATLATLRATAIPRDRASTRMWIATDGSIFAFSTTGMLSIGPDGTIRWERPFRRPNECTRPIASSTLDVAGCGDEIGTVELWNLHTGDEVAVPFAYQEGGAGDLARGADEHELLLLSALAPSVGRLRVDGAGLGSRIIAAGQTAISTFDTTGTRLITEDRALYAMNGAGSASAFSVWDTVHDRAVFRVPQDVKDHYDGYLSDDARWITDDLVATWLVTETADAQGASQEVARPRVIDIRTGHFVETGLPDDTSDLYPNAERTRVYVATGDGSPSDCSHPANGPCFPMRVLDTRSLKLTHTRFLPDGDIQGVAEVDHGDRVITVRGYSDAVGPRATVFDGRTGARLHDAMPHMYGVTTAGADALVGWGQTGVAEYSARTAGLVSSLPPLKTRTNTATVTRDGDTLLAAGHGAESVWLVDLKTLRVLGAGLYADELTTTGTIPTSAIAPNGSGFAISMPQGVALWTLDPGRMADALCGLAGREPTREQWLTYFGQLGAQQPLCPSL